MKRKKKGAPPPLPGRRKVNLDQTSFSLHRKKKKKTLPIRFSTFQNSLAPSSSALVLSLPMRASIPQTSRAMGRLAVLPAPHAKRIKIVDEGNRRRHCRRLSLSSSPPPSSSLSALPTFLADLPPQALAAGAATAVAAAASAATRFALLSAVDYAVATRLSAAVAPVRDPSSPGNDRKRALLLPSAGKENKGDGSRQGSRDLFLLPDRVGDCVAGGGVCVGVCE